MKKCCPNVPRKFSSPSPSPSELDSSLPENNWASCSSVIACFTIRQHAVIVAVTLVALIPLWQIQVKNLHWRNVSFFLKVRLRCFVWALVGPTWSPSRFNFSKEKHCEVPLSVHQWKEEIKTRMQAPFYHHSCCFKGAWRDHDLNHIFAHCSLSFYSLDFKFSNFVCPSELYLLIWFF